MQDTLARKLRVLRAERGLTLREAEQLTGVDKDTLSKIERGLRHPYDVTLSKLAKGYDVPVDDLLEEPVPLGETPAPGPSAPDPREYDEILIPRCRLTSEVFRGMLEALKEHEDQMEDLSVSMQEGYVEVGLKDRENDAIKGPDAAVWGPDESRPKVPMPESAGKHIHVQIEGGQATITETPFLDIARELHGRRITPEDAWQRLLDESA